MRQFLLATAATLAFVASSASANAQFVIYDSNAPPPPGIYIINTPPFYNGLVFNNGVITAFPTYPPLGYPVFGYQGFAPYSGYPSYYGRHPSSPGYRGYPGVWRP